MSADLGGALLDGCRKAERVKTLFLSPLQPQKRGGGGGGGGWGGGGGGRGGYPGFVSLQVPHLRSSRFSRHPRLRQAPPRRFAKKS